jgi:hypothetical protein
VYPRHSESNRLGRAGSRRSSLPVLQSKCASSSSIAPSRARWGGLVEKILSSALGALRPENRSWGPRTLILGASWIAFLSNPHPLHDIHLPICGKEIIMNFVKARRPLFISNGDGFQDDIKLPTLKNAGNPRPTGRPSMDLCQWCLF